MPQTGLRVFLDANVLFSAAHRENAGLGTLWKLQEVQLLTSLYAIQEAANNLATEDQRARLRQLLEDVETVEAVLDLDATLPAGLPEKDRPILGAAAGAKADFFLTGDAKHFGAYFGKIVCGVRVERPAEFLRLAGR